MAGASRLGARRARKRPGNARKIKTRKSEKGKVEKDMNRETRSFAELQAVCLRALRQCQGFEMVNEVLVQPRENSLGAANWTLAAVRPRVDNNALRAARGTIDFLQKTYWLDEAEAAAQAARRRR
jgi:hypothetical protein